MNCKTLHKELIFFIDGDLPADKMKQIQNHLNECESCAAFAEDLKKTLGIVEEEKQVEVNPFFYTRVKARLEKSETKEVPVSQPVLARVLQPVLFSVLLLIGIYSGIKIGQTSPVQAVNTAQLEQEVVPYLNEMATESIESFLME